MPWYKLVLVCVLFQNCNISAKRTGTFKNPTSRVPQADASANKSTTLSPIFYGMLKIENEVERMETIKKYLESQRDFYFISQRMVNTFDDQLQRLHHLKEQDIQLEEGDFDNFDKIRFKKRLSWEFFERKMSQLNDLYEIILFEANAPSSQYHQTCLKLLNGIEAWILSATNTPDAPSVLSIAEHFDDINEDLRKKYKDGGGTIIRIPSYRAIYDANSFFGKVTANEAFSNPVVILNKSKTNLYDSDFAKEWLAYKESRLLEGDADNNLWLSVQRKPQALDVLYPDAYEPGFVTGNKFPKNTWALTLDDGPHPVHTAGMFKVLRDANMTGTFFWQTKNLKNYPEFSAEAEKLGFNRASHSYTHANLPKLSNEELNYEINDAFDDFEKIVGRQPTLFRCPYGACGPMGSKTRQMIAKRNALHISWNVDTLDWQDKNPQSIFERAKKQMELVDHGIVLFHDIHSQSVEALRLLTKYINQKGYSVKALPEIISEVRGQTYESP